MKKTSLLLCAIFTLSASAHGAASSNAFDPTNMMARHTFCRQDNVEVLKQWLIAKNEYELNDYTYAVLSDCAVFASVECIRFFLANSPNLDIELEQRNDNLALMLLSRLLFHGRPHTPRHCTCVKMILNAIPTPEILEKDAGLPLIHRACSVGCPTCVQAVCDTGVNLRKRDSYDKNLPTEEAKSMLNKKLTKHIGSSEKPLDQEARQEMIAKYEACVRLLNERIALLPPEIHDDQDYTDSYYSDGYENGDADGSQDYNSDNAGQDGPGSPDYNFGSLFDDSDDSEIEQ
ncbi:hypothetical protein K2W90_04560 [Candidatus Babeliales bacterium]|nr:hypothetical protein [Candidatus Babeliales bacterium]